MRQPLDPFASPPPWPVPGRTCVLAAVLVAGLAGTLAAQSITVVANRSFRPTAVLQPHAQYWLATDSTDGALVLRDITINPVTIGTVRIEGIEPMARQGEARPLPDTVRFDADGRVVLTVSNGPGRPPLGVELIGARTAPALRIAITARDWPLNRVMLVSLAPADLHEFRWRSVGWGVQDRVRIDEREGVAFLSDSTTGPTTVAVRFGGGVRGRIQGDAADVMVRRDVDGARIVERRRVAALSLIVEPVRDAAGNVRADILIGLGTSEGEADLAARSAAGETYPSYGRALLRLTTPAPDVSLLLAHLLGAARPMLDYDRIAGLRHTPAGSYTFLAAFDRDGWYGALTALQLGDPAVVCGEYQLFKRYAEADGAQRHEIWNRLSARGRVLWTDPWGSRWMGDKEPYQLLKGYACYRATRDAAWLAAELPNLRRIARYMLATDADGDALLEGASDATYSEMSPLAGDSTYRTEDPYVNALSAYALERVAELEDAAQRGAGDSLRAAATRIRAALPRLWRPERHWFAYHAMPDGVRSWDHDHLQPVDALVFGGVTDSTTRQAMVGQVLRPGWWDANVRAFTMVPSDDSWYDGGSYWRGIGWHILDFKALQAVFVYGTPAQRAVAWQRLTDETTRIIRTNYARPGERADNNGLFMFSAGAYLDLVGRGLFGVEERLDQLEIAPHVDGIADEQTWRLEGWILGQDTLSLTYRPADRALAFRVGALHRTRVVLRLPWFSPAGCVTVRRGPDAPERLTPVVMDDGSVYVDIRGAFDPAEVRVSAAACGP
jgi:hypothetical protein